jgi:hypothetical protein
MHVDPESFVQRNNPAPILRQDPSVPRLPPPPPAPRAQSVSATPVENTSAGLTSTTSASWQSLLQQAAVAFAGSYDTNNHQRAIDRFSERGRLIVDSVVNERNAALASASASASNGESITIVKDEIETRAESSGGRKRKGKGREKEVIELLDTDEEG